MTKATAQPEIEDILPEVIELKENKNYLKVDQHYAKTVYLQEYPAELSDTFIYELLEIPRELSDYLTYRSA